MPPSTLDSETDDSFSENSDSDDDPTFKPSTVELLNDSSETNTIAKNKPNVRWRKANTSQWRANIAKKRRSACKAPTLVNCDKCRYKCTQNFTMEERTNICKEYWALELYSRKKDFILNHVNAGLPKRSFKTFGASKSISRANYLRKNEVKIRVCKKIFETTLCISNGPIDTAFKIVSQSGCFSGDDNEGKKSPGNKTTENEIKMVCAHIESFPCMDSHYVRKSSTRKYLDTKLSVLKMYDIYKELCDEQNIAPVSCTTYRRIFGTKYNLTFFKPKKDQCAKCNKYISGDALKKSELLEDFGAHIQRKNECNAAKAKDKERAERDESFQTATFDLQSVSTTSFGRFPDVLLTKTLCLQSNNL